MGVRIKEIYSLSIHIIQAKEQIRVVCEECDELASYLVNKGGKEKYLCKNHLHTWIKETNKQYHIRQSR